MSRPPSSIPKYPLDLSPEFRLSTRHFDAEIGHVAKMHRKFDLGIQTIPSLNVPQPLNERITCLQEELLEFAAAVRTGDLPSMADALVDLAVFAKGTAVQLGLPWAELFDDVMRANMAKVRGVGPRGHKVDLIKPPGWQGPKTEEILRRHGWKPDQLINGCEP